MQFTLFIDNYKKGKDRKDKFLSFFSSNYIFNHSVGHETGTIFTVIDYLGIQGYIPVFLIFILKHRMCILQVRNKNIWGFFQQR